MPTDLKALVLKSLLSYQDRLNLHGIKYSQTNEVSFYEFDCHKVKVSDTVTVWSDNFDENFIFTWEEINKACNV